MRVVRRETPLRGQRGAALLAVLLMMTLVGVVTIAIVGVVQADLAAGMRQQQAVQVFNVAEAGVHYGIGRLQTTGANLYTGETIAITDGSTTIGHASVTVRCMDGSVPQGASPCSALQPNLRRIRSAGSLAVPGPARVLTAVVEGSSSITNFWAICAYDGITFDQGVSVWGDVGTNGNLALARGGGSPSKICDSSAIGACPAPNPPSSEAYAGSAFAVGTIRCGGGACNSTQIEGTIAPNQPGPVCPVVTLAPPSTPGTTNLNVPLATTITLDPTTNYGDVTLASTSGAACPANVSDRSTLIIDSGADPNATVTVRMRRLHVGKCGRVVVTGSGKVDLWLLEPATSPPENAAQALKTEQLSIFGSTATGATPVPIGGDRFTVSVLSSKPLNDPGDCFGGASSCAAVQFNQAGLISGTFVIPNGGFNLDQAQITNGAVLAKGISFDRDTTFTWDPRSKIGNRIWVNFNRLRAWKDQ